MRRGFTLIELMVVVAIIGVLAAILTPSIQGLAAKARDARRRADLHTFEIAFEAYRQDNGRYPIEAGCTETSSGGDSTCGSCSFGCSNYWETN